MRARSRNELGGEAVRGAELRPFANEMDVVVEGSDVEAEAEGVDSNMADRTRSSPPLTSEYLLCGGSSGRGIEGGGDRGGVVFPFRVVFAGN